MSFVAVLFLIFLVLKLCHLIAWSWWWVTSPLWGAAALSILYWIFVAIIAEEPRWTIRR